jgi:hypothetical protein
MGLTRKLQGGLHMRTPDVLAHAGSQRRGKNKRQTLKRSSRFIASDERTDKIGSVCGANGRRRKYMYVGLIISLFQLCMQTI